MDTKEILKEKEISKLIIDLVWSATDGGCKLKESDFSHFEEPLHEWTALVSKFSTSIKQARAEERERMMKEIEKKRKTKKTGFINLIWGENLRGEMPVLSDIDVGYNQALDDILSSLND